MNLYYIKANITIRVRGISGPFKNTISWLVYADNEQIARDKYESRIKLDHAHMQFDTINYEYVEFTGTIK